MTKCMFKGPILCVEHDASVQRTHLYEDCTKNRFMMHVKRTNLLGDTACSYTHLCKVSSEGTMSCTKDQLYGNSTYIE